MKHNTKENFLFTAIVILFLIIGGKELFAFDKAAQPNMSATWTIDNARPELVPLGVSDHRYTRVRETSELQLYLDSYDVAIYSPATAQYFVIHSDTVDDTIDLYNVIAIQYTYYMAEDLTYNYNAPGNTKDNRDGRAAELFLRYLYALDTNYGYGTDQTNNKYNLDPLIVILDRNYFIGYMFDFNVDLENYKLSKFRGRHKYLDITDESDMTKVLGDMLDKIALVYNYDTVKQWFYIRD